MKIGLLGIDVGDVETEGPFSLKGLDQAGSGWNTVTIDKGDGGAPFL